MRSNLVVLVGLCLVLALAVGACASGAKKAGCENCPEGMVAGDGAAKHGCTEDPDAAMVCPVSGKGIAEGKGVEEEIGGKEVTFCCPKCVAAYEANPEKYQREG